jgi:hypothetical protein
MDMTTATAPCDATVAKKSASTTSTSSPTTTCHILPCNIDYSGMAPSHLYFHPVELPGHPGMYGSTFRGRGLLAKKPFEESNNNDQNKSVVQPLLLAVHSNQIITVKADNIDTVLEWDHEHNPTTFLYNDDKPSRWQRAQAWNEVASAVGRIGEIEITTKICVRV